MSTNLLKKYIFLAAVCVLSLSFLPTSSAQYDAVQAREFWNYCMASYCPDSKLSAWNVAPISKDYPDLTDIRIIHNSTGNSQAYIAFQPKENAVYVIFRGTVPWSITNWIDDIDTIKTSFPECSGCEVHEGFYKTYLDIKVDLLSTLDQVILKYPSASIRVTGHSLGGALATYGAHDIFKRYGRLDVLYTFGSPRVGNSEFAAWWNSQYGSLFKARITHKCDPVPHLPFEGWGFQHVNTEVYYPSTDVSQFKICNADQEDPNCANSHILDLDVNDHLSYMEQNVIEYDALCIL